jgi:hypothetical protein
MTFKQRTKCFESMGIVFEGENVEDVVRTHRETIKQMVAEHKQRFAQDSTPPWKLEQQMIRMFRAGLNEVRG